MIEIGEDDVALDVLAWQGDACVGTVVEAGARARPLLGACVLAGTADACGECEVCRAGGASVCPLAKPRTRGARRTVAMSRWLVPLADGLDLPLPAAAAVPGDVALAYTAYARTSLSPADSVVLVGKSPVTRFLVEILRAKAIAPTVVLEDDDAAWSTWLAARGAAVVRLTSHTDAATQLRTAIAAQGRGTRPTRVIATSTTAIDLACDLAHRRGTLTLLPSSLPGPGIGLAAAREVTVIGVARAHPDLIVEVAAMCAKHEIDLAAGASTEPTDSTVSALVVP